MATATLDLEAMQAESNAKSLILAGGIDCKHVYRVIEAPESDIYLAHWDIPCSYALFLDDNEEAWTAIFTPEGEVVTVEGW